MTSGLDLQARRQMGKVRAVVTVSAWTVLQPEEAGL